MIRRTLMPPQPAGGIKKQLAQVEKEQAVRVRKAVNTLLRPRSKVPEGVSGGGAETRSPDQG